VDVAGAERDGVPKDRVQFHDARLASATAGRCFNAPRVPRTCHIDE
jgi:hypothetical protein